MSTMNINQKALLALVRSSLWFETEELPQADWEEVEKLAVSQGILWMLYLGAKTYPAQIPSERVRIWRGAMHASVLNNDAINKVQSSMVDWLSQRGIRAAILKGTSCSQYYPYPEARSLGDIDVLVDKNSIQVVGEYLVSKGFELRDKDSVLHHEYCRNDCLVEVHYSATSVPDSKGGQVVSAVITHFLDDVNLASIDGISFPVLSEAHQALMLVLHMERHMIIGGIGLRQLCDWAAFVANSSSEHWEQGTLALIQKCGLMIFAKVLTKTCVRYLGLDLTRASWCADVGDELTDSMAEEIFRGGSLGNADQEKIGNLFTDRKKLGTSKQGKYRSLIAYLNKLANKNWPITKKARVLLPLYWCYIPLRYLVRSMLGFRPKRDFVNVIAGSNKREAFYRSLHLYEIED